MAAAVRQLHRAVPGTLPGAGRGGVTLGVPAAGAGINVAVRREDRAVLQSVQPSSSFSSNLPEPVEVQVIVLVLSSACCVVSALASMYVPFGSTTLCASPMLAHPLGGDTLAQLSVVGL